MSDAALHPRRMLGRLATEACGGGGVLIHLVPHADYTALCGKRPGRRSVGWSGPVAQPFPAWGIECPRCAGKARRNAIPTVAECRQQPDRDPGAVSAHVNSILAPSDGPCLDCGYPAEVWFAPNDVWDRVVPERTGLLCLRCFVARARRAGLDPSWKLEPERLDCEVSHAHP